MRSMRSEEWAVGEVSGRMGQGEIERVRGCLRREGRAGVGFMKVRGVKGK